MRQWWRSYACCGLLILVGLYAIFVPEPIGDFRTNKETLAHRGVPVQAVVTGKSESQSRSPHSHSAYYAYQVNGQTLQGSASLTAQEYLQTTIGQGLRVVYLPDHPEISDYHPDRWIASNPSSNIGGIVFLAFGLLSFLAVAFVHYTQNLAAERGARPAYQPPARRTYGAPLMVSAICVLFIVVGIAFQIQTLAMIASGQDIPVSSNLGGTYQTTAASPGMKVVLALFPVLAWGFGLGLLVFCRAYSVTTSPEGIEVRKFPGKVIHWRWEQIRTAKRRHDRSGTHQYILGNGSEEVWVSTVDDQESLSAEIERRLAGILR